MKKIFMFFLLFLFIFSSCQQLDIIGNNAILKFDIILKLLPDNISFNEAKHAWELVSPDGITSFFFNSDSNDNRLFDIWIEFDATPFIDSGLEIVKLPNHLVFDTDENRIKTGLKIKTNRAFDTPIDTFEHIVRTNRMLVKYHEFGDHYGIELGNNNMLHWARKVELIQGDLSFIMNQDQFKEAGADVTNIAGWRNPTVRAHNGRRIVDEVRVVKPFNLAD
ncbi:MAG: hypothetical protein FWG98_08560 [Candidatus Cloacimonetes bacterium]|nr:hypothetical protein [Candidatus Cloacimonadota bacterium]